MERQWHYGSNGQQYGPVAEASLIQMIRSGQLGPLDHAWTQGMTSWTPIQAISSLAHHIPSSAIDKPGSYRISPSGSVPTAGIVALVAGGIVVAGVVLMIALRAAAHHDASIAADTSVADEEHASQENDRGDDRRIEAEKLQQEDNDRENRERREAKERQEEQEREKEAMERSIRGSYMALLSNGSVEIATVRFNDDGSINVSSGGILDRFEHTGERTYSNNHMQCVFGDGQMTMYGQGMTIVLIKQ